jgi:hypothetical protein
MRFFLQILGLLAIVVVGWNQPFCDVARTLLPWAQIPPSRVSLIKAKSKAAASTQPVVAPTPARPRFSPSTSLAPPSRR